MIKKDLARPLSLSLAGFASLAALVASPVGSQELQRGDRVEVTGSNIKRVQSETASPVQVLTREDIQRSGKTSVAELLQTLAIDNQGSVPISFGNGFSRSGAGISLRGLGVGATLVLINGRRVAPFPLADDGTKQYTDLNVLPLEAVERIEIEKDGGSAIYGSDAIAGVVNIILRKEFQGIEGRASVGQSLNYGDGRQTQVSLTGGFGNLDTDRYNVFLDGEYLKQEPVFYSNRSDRGRLGKADLRSDGFTNQDTTAGGSSASGAGYILTQANGAPSTASSSINGSVRDPFAGVAANGAPFNANTAYFNRGNLTANTGFTRQFPGAACSNFTSHPQGDPGGGCIIDQLQQYREILPRTETFNFYGRANFAVSDNVTAYVEGNLYHNQESAQLNPGGITGTAYAPTVINSSASLGTIGALFPDNPYFGTSTRLRYLTADIPKSFDVATDFDRFVIGAKGSALGWDFDTAAEYSHSHLKTTNRGFLQIDVLNAVLNPTAGNVATATANSAAYRALPAGTYYRIGENAGLNSSAFYNALAPDVHSYANSVEALVDFKVSRELFKLPGGPLGFAAGVEARHEQNSLTPTEGTERANVLGIGYSSYALARNIEAAYVEAIAPVIKQVELSAAARYDHYQIVGNSFTPKAGIKITPIEQLAIRGTFSRGFRAPNAAESGGGTTAGSTSTDPVRCALGIVSACSSSSVSIISAGSKNLAPERSKTYTGGFVLDPTKDTSIAIDYFKIVRMNEIQGGLGDNATKVLAGSVLRDPTQVQVGVVGDPGVLLAIISPYTNANKTQVNGIDLDARQDFGLGSFGKISLGAKYTHLFSYLVTDNLGNTLQYANTHGNCNVTNCIGTPWNRANADITYIFGPVKVSTIAEYRGSFPNIEYKGASCETLVGGQNNPGNCRIGSFLTFDLTGRWQATKNIEVFGTIQNLFDKQPPYDPTTYGAYNYNPLDYSGAVGRFFSAGARVKF
jgi:iron complex outermembrane receptor protein